MLFRSRDERLRPPTAESTRRPTGRTVQGDLKAAGRQGTQDTEAGKRSVLQVLAAGGAARIAGQEAEDEDPDEEENDRVNRDLESEHDCPAVGWKWRGAAMALRNPDGIPGGGPVRQGAGPGWPMTTAASYGS